MEKNQKYSLSKVPEVTLIFWIIKIAATTLGETGGDLVTMSLNLGYLVGSIIFVIVFMISVFVQIKATHFSSPIYWTTIIATTTLGTTLADFFNRSLGIGYTGGTLILTFGLVASLIIWHRTLGAISINTISTPKEEVFYWSTIMFSQTLGTALGDWTADTAGLGYNGGVIIFGSILGVLCFAHYYTTISKTFLFWSAFIITRPLGAVVGDFLDKPIVNGGLALSRYSASLLLLAFIVFCILIFPPKAATKSH
jgi:uncharacterized membrane-anchored protein